MKKTLKSFIILMISLLVMVACGDDDTSTGNNGNEQDKSTNGTDQTETDDIDEDTGEADVETDDSDSSDIENDGDVPVLSIGETGVMETILGTYEVTVNSFWFADELSDGDDVSTPGNGVFVVADITIKNIDEKNLELESIAQARLFRDSGGTAGYDDYPTLESFLGELAPGESATGQIGFNYFVEDYYELSFGAHLTSDVSNEVRWALHAEDAE